MLSLWEVLKASKGLPASDGFTALFAEKLTGIVSEISGIPPLNLGKAKDVVDYTLTGNTIQNGTPTPDNPVEVHAVGDRTGNLFDYTAQADLNNSAYTGTPNTYLKEDGTLTESSGWWTSDYIEVMGDFATVSNVGGNLPAICAYDVNKNFIRGKAYKTGGSQILGSCTIDTTGAKYVRFSFIRSTMGAIAMLNEGTEPLPYEPYGYRISVETRGKNLLEITEDNSIYYDVLNGYTINDNKVHVTGQSLLGFKAEVQPNTTYTIQRKRTPSVMCDFRIREYSAEPTEWMSNHILQSVNTTSDTATFTTSAETKWVLVTVYVTAKQEAFTIYDVQLELGSTATEYEPYHEPITTTAYLDKPLYKIGDYADSINCAKQKAERVVKEYIFNISRTITLTNGNVGGVSSNFDAVAKKGIGFCDKAPYGGISAVDHFYVNQPNCVFVAAPGTTLEEMKAKYDGAKVYYVLATPETEFVNLPKIPTLDGTTVIDVETEIEPSNMYLKYKSRR